MPESPKAKDDDVLRAAHFKLLTRPKQGPDLWKRGGRVWTEAEALRLATADRELAKVR